MRAVKPPTGLVGRTALRVVGRRGELRHLGACAVESQGLGRRALQEVM